MQKFSDLMLDWQHKKFDVAEILKICISSLKQYYVKKIKSYPILTKLSKAIYRILIFIMNYPSMLMRKVKSGLFL